MNGYSRQFQWAAVLVMAVALLLQRTSPPRDQRIAIAAFDESGGTIRDAARRF